MAHGKGTSRGCKPGDEGTRRLLSNSPMGLGNQSPWSGEPWANQGEPDHGNSAECPELRDSGEMSAGLRVDPEVPGSKA